MSNQNEGSNAFAVGFLLGAAAGVAVALMTAPRSGEETIDQVRTQSIQLKLRAEELGSQTRQRAAQRVQQVQGDARVRFDQLESRGRVTLQQAQEAAETPAE